MFCYKDLFLFLLYDEYLYDLSTYHKGMNISVKSKEMWEVRILLYPLYAIINKVTW